MWLTYALFSAVFAALVAIFGKLGLSKVDSTLATTIRSLVMALFLVLVTLSLKKFQGFTIHELNGKQWLYIVLAGVAGALSWLFYFAALKSGQATKVAAIDRLSIVFVLIFAVLFLGESFKVKPAIGAALMALGAILMSIK
jgi:transporter family protein